MSYTLEAYWQQETNHGIVDRIEVQQLNGSSRNLELEASGDGFNFRWSEITSESDKGLINPLANKIQVGKLTFFPKIGYAAENTLLQDILGSPDNSFRIVWKRDGSTFWTGNIDNKKRSYPETGGPYFATIRANDFEYLKGIDYTLDDTRQTLITTIADLLGKLNLGLNIRTATSWIEEHCNANTDFLSQIYHETKALRNFANTGDETDQPISVWEALEKVGAPALLFRQVNGEFTVEQLSEFDDPANVHETVYDSTGAVVTATTTVDRRINGHKSIDSGNLVIKEGSLNDQYPAVKRAKTTFDHRTKINGIIPSTTVSDDNVPVSLSASFTRPFISTGGETIELFGNIKSTVPDTFIDSGWSGYARWSLKAGSYFYDGDTRSWGTTEVKNKDVLGFGTDDGSNIKYSGVFGAVTTSPPADADPDLVLTLYLPVYIDDGDENISGDATYSEVALSINSQFQDANTSSITYELTQTDGYSTRFELGDTCFGDGPAVYSVSALRHGLTDGNLTNNSWQRRGSVSYRSFHENLLKEILDIQRSYTRKLNADFYGSYNPSKILVYDSQNFYCAGASYTGVIGKWSADLFCINLQSGSDTFDNILKFSSGEGAARSGRGGVSEDAANATYFRIDKNLAEGDPSAMRANLDVYSKAEANTRYLQVANNLSELSTITGVKTFDSDVHFQGNIFQDGSTYETHVEQLYTEKDFIISRDGALGGLAAGALSGLKVLKADGIQNVLFGTDNSAIARVGWEGDTLQAIATREDAPALNGIPYFDSEDKFATSANATLDALGNAVLNTLNTGQGANELYPMDQGVRTSDIVGWEQEYFNDVLGDKISLYGNRLGSTNMYGFGVNSGFLYAKSNGGYRWYSDQNYDGVDATHIMELEGGGALTLTDTLTGVDASFSDALSAKTFRPDSGKFLSPVRYQFRNAGDTGFRDVQMAGLQATTGVFSGAITGADNLTIEKISRLKGDAYFYGDVQSDNAVSRVSGWQGNRDGAFDFRSIFADSLTVKAFTADVAQAFRGSTFLTKSFATIDQSFTVPAVSGSATLTVRDIEGYTGLEVFEQNDFILLSIVNQSGGGLTVGEAWGEITSTITDNGDGTQSFTFTTRSVSTSNIAGMQANEGSEALSFGSATDPKGFIHSTVLDNLGSPYSQTVTWTANPWDRSNWTVQTRTGNLAGIANADGFGFYGENTFLTGSLLAGDLTKAGQYLEYDQGVLTLKGSLTITGGTGIANLLDAGELATKNAAEIDVQSLSNVGGLASKGSVDLSTNEVTNKTADNIAESTTKKWAGESGANITGNHTSADTAKVAGETASTVKNNASAGKQADTDLGALATNAYINRATGKVLKFDGQGALATKSNVDLATDEVLNKNTNYLTDGANLGGTADWSGVVDDNNNKPADNADVTSAQFSQSLNNIDAGTGKANAGLDNAGNVKRILSGANLVDGVVADPDLYATSTNLGYYNGTKWTAYIENDGSFFFRDANDKGISFVAGEADFAIDANNFALNAGSGDLIIESATPKISVSDFFDVNASAKTARLGTGNNSINYDVTNGIVLGSDVTIGYQQVTGLEIGGRNYFSATKYAELEPSSLYDVSPEGYLIIKATDTRQEEYSEYNYFITVEPNSEYVLHFSEGMNDRFYGYDSAGNQSTTFTKLWNADNTVVHITTGSDTVEIGGKFFPLDSNYPRTVAVKFEQGVIATDWTPAPEEMTNPGYITSTKITQTTIETPNLVAATGTLGVLTATDQITLGTGGSFVSDNVIFDKTDFTVDYPNLYIDAELADLRVGNELSPVFEADGVANTVSMAGGVLTADSDSVGLAGFDVDSNSIYADDGLMHLSLGLADAWTSGVFGLQVGTDVNNRIWLGHGAGNYEMVFREGGQDYIRISSGEKRIASSYFDATRQWGGNADPALAGILFDYANGDIILDNDGMVSNTGGSFGISKDGFFTEGSSSYIPKNSYNLLDGGTTYGALFGGQDFVNLETFSGTILRLTGSSDIQLSADQVVVNVTDTTANAIRLGGNVFASGDIASGGVKTFLIDHPNPALSDSYKLAHAAVESPTAGENLYRYNVEATTDNEVVNVQLPDYFKYLNKNIDVYVTPVEHFGMAYGKVNANDLKVKCEKAGKYNVLIIGTRKDKGTDNWQGVVRPKE